MNELNLIVTEERLKELSLETFYMIGGNSPKASIEFVAHFAADKDGNYLPKKEAIASVVKDRTVGDIEGIMEQLTESMKETAVPKA